MDQKKNTNSSFRPELLEDIVKTKIPFGKFKGVLFCDIPLFYLEWFHNKGFPKGKTGILLATIYEIKLNGLEYLLEPLKKSMNYPEAEPSGYQNSANC